MFRSYPDLDVARSALIAVLPPGKTLSLSRVGSTILADVRTEDHRYRLFRFTDETTVGVAAEEIESFMRMSYRAANEMHTAALDMLHSTLTELRSI